MQVSVNLTPEIITAMLRILRHERDAIGRELRELRHDSMIGLEAPRQRAAIDDLEQNERVLAAAICAFEEAVQ